MTDRAAAAAVRGDIAMHSNCYYLDHANTAHLRRLVGCMLSSLIRPPRLVE